MNSQIVLLVLVIFNFSQIATSASSISAAACDPTIKFYLWTKTQSKVEIKIDVNYSEAGNSFIPGGKTVFLYHGFQSNCSAVIPIRPGLTYTVQGSAEAYLDASKGNYDNFICVDAGQLFGGAITDYFIAAGNTQLAGQCGANMAVFLTNPASGYNQNLADIFVYGHSLGAPAAGRMGHYFNEATNLMLPNIMGLDPAGPGFVEGVGNWTGILFPPLTKNDATFVQGIHTNIAIFGNIFSVGHADFYVGIVGAEQPYCLPNLIPGTCNYGAPSRPLTCSHEIAGSYMIESLDKNAPGFKGCRVLLGGLLPFLCLSPRDVVMGPYASTSTRGTFFIQVNTCPNYFSRG